MNNRMMIGHLYPGKIHPAAFQNDKKSAQTQNPVQGNFQEILNENLLKISHHAAKRLEQRGIELQGDQLMQIQSAVDKAAAKGSKESLILLENMALIVNIPNRTVVTAMDGKAMKDNVFTQIDSAVIIS